MNNRPIILSGFFVLSLTTAAIAEGGGKLPILVDSARNVITLTKRDKQFDLPADAHAAVKRFRIRSVPYWTFYFSYQGTTYGAESVVGKSIFTDGGPSVGSVADHSGQH
jgi:hypothetical protein